MWQDIAVLAAVLGAGAYAAWYLLPGPLRARFFRWRPSLAKAPGCSACSECAGCGPKPGPQNSVSPAPAALLSSDGSRPIKIVRRN